MKTPSNKWSDEELVALIVKQGRTELFEHIYDRYANKVYRKCISFVKDEPTAQDMVQDIFLKVFFKLSKFKGNSRFSTWLYAVTYNFCVEYYRKHGRIHTVELDDRLEVPTDDNTLEEEILSFRTEQLKKALESVDPKDKMILLMKYQDGVSIKEIMDQLNISESAVKMRLSRARKRVKECVMEMENSLGYV